MVSGVCIAVLATFLYFALLILECTAREGTPWATPDQEALDEVRDAEILKAVVTSMQEWEKRHSSHRVKRAESSVCYPEVGCFQDSAPFSYLDMLPSPPEEVSTRFFLYSGRARGNTPVLDVPFTNISDVWAWAGKAFNLSAPTKVIVHGFGGSCSHVWVYEMRSALMTVEECNVICVDWEAGAVIPNYVRAAANTRLVGKQLSMLLAGLNKHIGLPIHNVHVIGFSLGAHVAGFAGAELKNLSRITGLDPAAPLFESQDPRARLDSTDAMFVDVIHSNGENLILGGLGSWQPMGDVDFYPNGGRMQKGCTNLFVGAVSDILWSASDVEGRSLCNHRRAYKFFTDSVSPRCHFPSFPCESYDAFLEGGCFPCTGDRRCGNMGYYADRSNGRGTLFLITREEEPFCAHQYHVRVQSSPNPDPVTSYGKIQLTLVGSSEINETFTLTQKDDEELKVGSSLARIAVPHPVLQEPKSVQIMYTAYSGWISSGLASWSIDKVTLTDSFGKSMSVCKKGLVLESGIPVDLPLYPGECNPPKENGLDDKDNWTAASSSTVSPQSTEHEKEAQNSNKQSVGVVLPENSTENFNKYTPTPVVQIGDELFNKDILIKDNQNGDSKEDRITLLDDAIGPVTPQALENIPWQPIDYLDNSNTNSLDGNHNKRENSRAFSSPFSEVVLNNETVTNHSKIQINNNSSFSPQNNSNSLKLPILSERPEIKEPVLIPSSSSHSSIWPREVFATRSAKDVLATINSTSESHLHKKAEITEPILNPKTTTTPRPSMVKAREISSLASENKWIPAVELNPPPIDGSHTWQHWITETTASNSVLATTEKHGLKEKSYNSSSNDTGTKGEDRKLTIPSPTTILKKSHSSPITIQFFPQRLAAILAQAERYARLTFSFPMTAMSKLMSYRSSSSDSSESDLVSAASSNRLYTINTQILPEDSIRRNLNLQTQRRPKQFTTIRPIASNKHTRSSGQSSSGTVNKSSVNNSKRVPALTTEVPYVDKDIPIFQPRIDYVGVSPLVKDTRNIHIFVPYAYVSHDDQQTEEDPEMPRYIPLLRYPYTENKNKKYEIHNYSKSERNSSLHSSEKPPLHVNTGNLKSDKDDKNHFNIFHHIGLYPRIPER